MHDFHNSQKYRQIWAREKTPVKLQLSKVIIACTILKIVKKYRQIKAWLFTWVVRPCHFCANTCEGFEDGTRPIEFL